MTDAARPADACVPDPPDARSAVTIDAAALAKRIAGAAAKDSAVAEALLAVATERVNRYAPGAPEAILNEAVVRYAGYLAQSDFGGIVKDDIGPLSQTYVTNHANAFRSCGAAGLLAPWRVRRAGAA